MMGKKKTAMKRGGVAMKRGGGMMGGKKKVAKKRGGGAMNQHKAMAMGMNVGGAVGKKKQGYKDRKDESIAMRVRKKRTKKQLKASRDESYGKFGSKARKKGKINR